MVRIDMNTIMKNTLRNFIKKSGFDTYRSGEIYIDNNYHTITISEVMNELIGGLIDEEGFHTEDDFPYDYPYELYHDNYKTNIAIGKFMLYGVTYNNPIIYEVTIDVVPSLFNRDKKHSHKKIYHLYVFIDQYYKLRYLDLPMTVTTIVDYDNDNPNHLADEYTPDLTKFSRKTKLLTKKFLKSLY